jgi:hypothetical protein
MATLPVSAEEVIARFGPSLNFPPSQGYARFATNPMTS